MSSKTPKLSEVLESAIGGWIDELQVASPGKILSYEGGDVRRANVQVQIKKTNVDGDGVKSSVTITIADVPVAHWGSGTMRIKVPVRAGDQCLLVFSSSSIAELKAGVTGPVEPGSDRHHHIADAIAIPVVLFGRDIEDDAIIEFTESGTVEIGGSEPLVTRAEFLGHTHATAGTGTPSPPISGPPGSAATFPGTNKLRG
jgi:hypothetical protein